MELHQLRYLVAVAHTGNFSRAAILCHVSQPSLSQQIRKLEDELGERLFDRLKSGARLTAEGEALHARAVRILAEVDAARREVSDARTLARGVVSMGVLPTIAPYWLPTVIPSFAREFPGVEIVVQEATTAELLKMIASCELDLAVASLPVSGPRLVMETLFTEELLVVLPATHRLAVRDSIRVTDLESERFILMKESHCLGDQVLEFCTRRDFHPNVSCRSAQVETIRALVQAGMGISLIPAMACHESTQAPELCFRRLTRPSPHRSIVGLWLRDRPMGRAGQALLRHLRGSVNLRPPADGRR